MENASKKDGFLSDCWFVTMLDQQIGLKSLSLGPRA